MVDKAAGVRGGASAGSGASAVSAVRDRLGGRTLAIAGGAALAATIIAAGLFGGAASTEAPQGRVAAAEARLAELARDRRSEEDALAILERRKNAAEALLAETEERIAGLEAQRAELAAALNDAPSDALEVASHQPADRPSLPARVAPADRSAAPAAGPMRVFIHVRSADAAARARAEAVAAELRAQGVAVAAIRSVPYAVRIDAVRFFYDADRTAVPVLQRAVRDVSAPDGRTPVGQDYRRYRAPPRPGTIELWLS